MAFQGFPIGSFPKVHEIKGGLFTRVISFMTPGAGNPPTESKGSLGRIGEEVPRSERAEGSSLLSFRIDQGFYVRDGLSFFPKCSFDFVFRPAGGLNKNGVDLW